MKSPEFTTRYSEDLPMQPVNRILFDELPRNIREGFLKARDEVCDDLVILGLTEKAEFLKNINIDSSCVFAESFTRDGELVPHPGSVEQQRGKQILNLRVSLNGNFSAMQQHAARHEMYHLISKFDSFKTGNTLNVRYSGTHFVFDHIDTGSGVKKRYGKFVGWNEAMMDISAKMSGDRQFNSLGYKIYTNIAEYIASKTFKSFREDEDFGALYKKVFEVDGLPIDSDQIINQFRKDCLTANFRFSKIVDYLYGEGTSKKIGDLGNGEVDDDYKIMIFFLEMHDSDELFDEYAEWYYSDSDLSFDQHVKEKKKMQGFAKVNVTQDTFMKMMKGGEAPERRD